MGLKLIIRRTDQCLSINLCKYKHKNGRFNQCLHWQRMKCIYLEYLTKSYQTKIYIDNETMNTFQLNTILWLVYIFLVNNNNNNEKHWENGAWHMTPTYSTLTSLYIKADSNWANTSRNFPSVFYPVIRRIQSLSSATYIQPRCSKHLISPQGKIPYSRLDLEQMATPPLP